MPTSGPLTEKELANGKEIFEAIDQDNDGKISTSDLKTALTNAGFEITDEEVAVRLIHNTLGTWKPIMEIHKLEYMYSSSGFKRG